MLLNIKKLVPEAVVPSRAKVGDAGYDLVAISKKEGIGYVEYGTGLAIELHEGLAGLLFPRSSISNTSNSLCNSVGLVDAFYRGEIKLRFRNLNNDLPEYNVGDKVGQLVIIQHETPTFLVVNELNNTERGTGGFGHSDVKKIST